MKDSILVTILLSQAKEYLQKKLRNELAFDLVDWQSRAQVMKILSSLIKVWLSKSFTNFAGTSHRLYQQGRWSTPKCHCCGIYVECDTFHIFECSN